MKLTDTVAPNFDFKKKRIEKVLADLGYDREEVMVNKDLGIMIHSTVRHNFNHLVKLQKALPYGAYVQSIGALIADSTEPMSPDKFAFFPRIIKALQLENVNTLTGIHKYIEHIDMTLMINKHSHTPLPSNMLGIALIHGPFALETENIELDRIFNQYRLRTGTYQSGRGNFKVDPGNLLEIQEKLIDAGYAAQAKL